MPITEHPYYSSAFHISGGRTTTLVGSMQDVSPWDHLDYARQTPAARERIS